MVTPRLATASKAALTAALATAVTAQFTDRLLRSPWPGWVRTNYRGRPVTLTGGWSVAVGSMVAASIFAEPGWRAAALVAGSSAAVSGAYDDLVAPRLETGADKGLGGHLRAARDGRVSGGVAKVAGIGLGAAGAARMISTSWRDALPRAALVASTANLVNLFDLRPGRAGKIIAAGAALQLTGPGGVLAAATAGAAIAGLPADLGETRLLGDLGANTLGALLGLSLAARGPAVRWSALTVITGLTVASERVSFSRVIDATPALRAMDRWGRLPVVSTDGPEPSAAPEPGGAPGSGGRV